jgi:dethiobiotin synthetase
MSKRRSAAGPPGAAPAVAVVGTVRRVGKTVVAAALAHALVRRGLRVGVFKPVAVGCQRRVRLGLVCPDAEFLAHCADAPHDLATINPVRFAPRLVPAECAARSKQPIDFDEIERCRARITEDSDVVIIETVGGLLEPLDRRLVVADLLARWSVPFILVAGSGADAISHVLMTLDCADKRGLTVSAVVLNRYTADGATLADELNPEAVARYAAVDMPIVIPEDRRTDVTRARLGPAVIEAVAPLAATLQVKKRPPNM